MSDLSSFNIYKTNANALVALEPNAPIAGSASLRVNSNGAGAGRVNMVRNTGSRAFTSGRARFACKVTGQIVTTGEIGFLFQQSQEDLTGASGTAYACFLVLSGAGSNRIGIYKCTAGIATKTLLFQSATTFNLSLSEILAVEVTWTLDIANLGGINFLVKKGTLADYSNLVIEPGIDNKVSTTGVLTSTVGEGPFVTTTSSDTPSYFVDSVRCNRVVVGG